MSATTATQILSPKLADFIGDPRMTIDACSRNIQLLPSIARGLACKADVAGNQITLWISASHSLEFIADLRQGHAIAIVICLPSTHQTIQIKGERAELGPPTQAELAYIEHKVPLLTAELGSMGFGPEYCARMLAYRTDDVLQVRFTPLSVFEQSPGSNAGKKLEVATW